MTGIFFLFLSGTATYCKSKDYINEPFQYITFRKLYTYRKDLHGIRDHDLDRQISMLYYILLVGLSLIYLLRFLTLKVQLAT